MADRALLDHLVATGLSADEATWVADRVFGAVRDLLAAGKTVGIPDVGRLAAPKKPIYLPGSCKRQAVEQRKVALRHPAIIERGAPYDV